MSKVFPPFSSPSTASSLPTSSSDPRPARTPPSPTTEGKASTASAPAFSSKPSASSESSDPVGHALKTFLASACAELTGSSKGWKRTATPSGAAWWALTTLAPTTAGNGSGSSPVLIPTPRATDGDRGGRGDLIQVLRGNKANSAHGDQRLPMLPTPTAQPYGTNQGGAAGRAGPVRPSLNSAVLALTPTAKGGMLAPAMQKQWAGARALQSLLVAMLPTPMRRDWRSGRVSAETMGKNSRPLSETIHSRGLTGTAALLVITEWMMGFPPGWISPPSRRPTATRSSRSSRSSSAGSS